MPFPVRWIITKKKKPAAYYESVLHQGMGYSFSLKKSCNGYETYECTQCKNAAKIKRKNNQHCPSIPIIRIVGQLQNARFQTNPDQIPHICVGDAFVDTRSENLIAKHHYK